MSVQSPSWSELDRWDAAALIVVVAFLVAINGCLGGLKNEPWPPDPCLIEGVEECAPECEPTVCPLFESDWDDGYAAGFAARPLLVCDTCETNFDWFRGCAELDGVCISLCTYIGKTVIECSEAPQ